jgi:hypothetical protein
VSDGILYERGDIQKKGKLTGFKNDNTKSMTLYCDYFCGGYNEGMRRPERIFNIHKVDIYLYNTKKISTRHAC